MRPSQAAQIVAEAPSHWSTPTPWASSTATSARQHHPDGPTPTGLRVARLDSSNLTVEGQFIGTPNFMAPEQILGRPVDRSDLFSLGWSSNLLTGKRPFPGANMHEVTLKITQAPCPIPSTVVEGLPRRLQPDRSQAPEKDPDKRFQSGAELARVLAALSHCLLASTAKKSVPPPSSPNSTNRRRQEAHARGAADPRPATKPSPAVAVGAPARVPRLVSQSGLVRRNELGVLHGSSAAGFPRSLPHRPRPWPAPQMGRDPRPPHRGPERQAERAFAGGDLLAAESSCLLALHHAPASPGDV